MGNGSPGTALVLWTYAAPVSLKERMFKPASSKVQPGAPDPPENRDHWKCEKNESADKI
jgi:hypothetical protein